MKKEKNLRRLFAFGVLFLGFAGYSFMSAATSWTEPAGTPPANNIDAPVNVGTTNQVKDGGLGVNTLSVAGNAGVTGGYIKISSSTDNLRLYSNYMILTSSQPFMQFVDADTPTLPGRLMFSGGNFYIQRDRNGDGTGSMDGPNPLTLVVGATSDEDYLKLTNQVRSPQYCDENGQNCFDSSEVGQTTEVLDNFGGMFAKDSAGTCKTQNPLTLACSCPAGYDVQTLATGLSGTMNNLYYCQANVKTCTVQFTTSADVASNAVKTGNTTYSKTFPEGTLLDVGQIYYGGSENYPNAYMDVRITGYAYNYSANTGSGYTIQQGWWYDSTYKKYENTLTTSGYSHPIKQLTVLSGKTVTSTFTIDWNKGASQEQSDIGGTITATVTSCN